MSVFAIGLLCAGVSSRPLSSIRTDSLMSRRTLLASAVVFGAGAVLPANAADSADVTRLVKGYNDIQFLLNDWTALTTTKEGARDADKVRKVLGLRSTSDPLFQLDKLLQKAVSRTDPDKIEQWIEATEKLNISVNNANEFAYTAAFGEYNPGGGKDQVDKYLELSHQELINVAKNLKTILDLLSLTP